MLKLTPKIKADVNRWADQGVSGREISKRTGLSVGTIAGYLRTRKAGPKASDTDRPSQAPVIVAPSCHKTDPASREEIRGVLSGQLMVLDALEAHQRASNEEAAAATTRRQIVQVSSVLAKLTRDESEDETGIVRVKVQEVESAAQKCREKIADLVQRALAKGVE